MGHFQLVQQMRQCHRDSGGQANGRSNNRLCFGGVAPTTGLNIGIAQAEQDNQALSSLTFGRMKTDVVIIGGGATGSVVAYFLKLLEPSLGVSVVERDPSYELASTPRASGGVRRLFSIP